ncbi:MAG: hypothetical protein KBA72_12330 [Thermoanaerobaculia bacterium]|nr:hypothetical protein [Thermoanaerobaculia bacterium]
MRSKLAFVVAIASLSAGCRDVEIASREFAAVRSPDGSRIAFVYRQELAGGAISKDSFGVKIEPADPGSAAREGGEIVWTAEKLRPLYLLWVDDRSLEVLLAPGDQDIRTVKTPSSSVSVSTRRLKTTLKSEIGSSSGDTVQ